MRYHVNPTTGEAGKCSAQAGNCPFGPDSPHYPTIESARLAYEFSMQKATIPNLNSHKILQQRADEAMEAYVREEVLSEGAHVDVLLVEAVALQEKAEAARQRENDSLEEALALTDDQPTEETYHHIPSPKPYDSLTAEERVMWSFHQVFGKDSATAQELHTTADDIRHDLAHPDYSTSAAERLFLRDYDSWEKGK